jgi:hypothetical protein
VVFLAVIKRLDWQYGALGLVVLLLVLLLAVNAYRKQRMRDVEGGGPGAGTDAR